LYSGETFCILTREACGSLANIHGRMPAVVPPERYGYWLGADVAGAARLIRKLNGRGLDGYKVSTRVNAPASNEATLIERMG
jgi:putative SOS response-associated peptidase YedK